LPRRATQQQTNHSDLLPSRPREHLRVLRYPNGDERVIRYPDYAPDDGAGRAAAAASSSATAPAAPAALPSASRAAPAAGSGDSGPAASGGSSGSSSGPASASLDDYLSWDVTGLWSSSTARPQAPPSSSSSSSSAAAAAPSTAAPADADAAGPAAETGAADATAEPPRLSDAEYLESLFAAAYNPPPSEQKQQQVLAPRGTSSRPAAAAAAAAAAAPASITPAPAQTKEEQPLPSGTYQVLEGCPWPMPRPLYTLALRGSASAAAAALASRLHRKRYGADGGGDDDEDESAAADDDRVGSTYTLSVRTRDRGAAGDLARALGKGAEWAARMDVGARRDGVVAFGSERDARRFAALLERPASADEPGGGHSGVAVARVDSHALFRAAADVRSMVVYLPPCGGDDGSSNDDDDQQSSSGRTVPRPHQLAAALLNE
jgi:hypothetical protein